MSYLCLVSVEMSSRKLDINTVIYTNMSKEMGRILFAPGNDQGSVLSPLRIPVSENGRILMPDQQATLPESFPSVLITSDISEKEKRIREDPWQVISNLHASGQDEEAREIVYRMIQGDPTIPSSKDEISSYTIRKIFGKIGTDTPGVYPDI